MAGRVPQVVVQMPSKCEALSSNPSTTLKQTSKKDLASFYGVISDLAKVIQGSKGENWYPLQTC
jgi:hypothetical protein